MKMSKGIIWEIVDANRYNVKKLLLEGWEPYAVTTIAANGEKIYHLRRQKPA